MEDPIRAKRNPHWPTLELPIAELLKENMSFEENSGLTPSFISLGLSGITHRFILLVECESRQSADGAPQINHPRFCVGGQRATLDPRNVSITELLPLATSKVDLPQGWEKVHQLIYGE